MLAMGRIDMAGDPELERNDGRVKRTAEIDDAIQAWCDTQDIDGALTVLKAADVPAGKIYSVRDMMVDPQFLARGMFEQHHFADGTPVKLPAISPKLSATPGHTKWIGPALGQHNDEVLRSLGYSAEDIAVMKRDGVL
jgi:formyl-CoA transferase